MEDLRAHDAEVHAGCGQHDSIAGTRDLRLEPLFCQDCADIEAAMRVQGEADESADRAKYGDKPPPAARRAADGRRWTIRVVMPEEKAAEAASTSSPSKPARGRRTRTGRSRSTG